VSAEPVPAEAVAAEVSAAGGAVVRQGPSGPEVLLVHRPRYGDWSLPKGKLDEGESDHEAALREVEEETGYRCTLGRELPVVRYEDGRGRAKRVRYWRMEIVGGEFRPNAEVDEIAWLGVEAARQRLSYAHDHEVVAAALR
jgi:8-oxo-dGTP pyrophosphatase MutT (NUDIX family)